MNVWSLAASSLNLGVPIGAAALQVDQFTEANPVFTGDEFRAACHPVASLASADRELEDLVAMGWLVAAAPGVYAVVPHGIEPARFRPNSILVASRLSPDAVISHFSATELHGLAYTVRMGGATVTATGPAAEVDTRSGIIQVAPAPDGVDPMFGTAVIEYCGLPVRMTGIERTLAECIERPDLALGFEEIRHALDGVEALDVDLLASYVERRRLSAVAAVVGWWLESRRDDLPVTDGNLARFRRLRPSALQDAPGLSGEDGVVAADWNIRLPREIAAPLFEGLDAEDLRGFDL